MYDIKVISLIHIVTCTYFYIACESWSSFASVDLLARWSHSNILIKVKSWIRIRIKVKI
jgi:hypothetical protein